MIRWVEKHVDDDNPPADAVIKAKAVFVVLFLVITTCGSPNKISPLTCVECAEAQVARIIEGDTLGTSCLWRTWCG